VHRTAQRLTYFQHPIVEVCRDFTKEQILPDGGIKAWTAPAAAASGAFPVESRNAG